MKGGRGFAELIGFRPVFGIVDDRQIAGCKLQCVIQGLRLGSRQPVRDDDQVDIAREGKLHRRLDRGGVHRLQDDLDIELRSRIIELFQGLRQMGQDLHLLEQRHEYRITRQFGVG